MASAFCLTTTDHTLSSQRASCFGHDRRLALPVVIVIVGKEPFHDTHSLNINDNWSTKAQVGDSS